MDNKEINRVTIYLPITLHTYLKVKAAKSTPREFVNDYIVEALLAKYGKEIE